MEYNVVQIDLMAREFGHLIGRRGGMMRPAAETEKERERKSCKSVEVVCS